MNALPPPPSARDMRGRFQFPATRVSIRKYATRMTSDKTRHATVHVVGGGGGMEGLNLKPGLTHCQKSLDLH
jgi:hypothetical protein